MHEYNQIKSLSSTYNHKGQIINQNVYKIHVVFMNVYLLTMSQIKMNISYIHQENMCKNK